MSVVFPFVVAVDGPAGSGKSSVSKEVARRLGFGFLDTGAAYRALAWHVEASGIDTDDAASVVSCLRASRTASAPTPPATPCTSAMGRDHGDPRPRDLGGGEPVARVSEVRAHLIELFRGIIAESRGRASSSRAATSRRWWHRMPPSGSC